MFEALIRYINSYISIPLTTDQASLIEQSLTPRKFRKKQYLLQEGDVSKFAAFIVKGAMRQYTVDDKGAEHIVQLYVENWWAADRESFTMLTPSIYNIDAWEDTDTLLLTNADNLFLSKEIPAMNELSRRLDDRKG